MIARLRPADAACGAAVLLLVLLAPPLRHALQSSMTAQMLVQIPLLAAAGWLAAMALPARLAAAIDTWNEHGVSGLVLATLASAFWMLPRALDAAVTDPSLAIAKYLSVPLLIGLPLALSWPRMGFVVKGVLLLEGIATLLRLGWLYLVSPERLCNLYLLDDQQRLGRLLLLTGAALFLGVACKLVCGRFDAPADTAVTPQPTQR
jgi:hypothetical protein